MIVGDLEDIPVRIPKNSYFLVNVTKNAEKGMHWIVLKNDFKKKKIIMFDSYDLPVTILPVRWAAKVEKSDECVFQNKKSIVCGQYCALFILNRKIMKLFRCTAPSSSTSVKNDLLCMNVYNELNK